MPSARKLRLAPLAIAVPMLLLIVTDGLKVRLVPLAIVVPMLALIVTVVAPTAVMKAFPGTLVPVTSMPTARPATLPVVMTAWPLLAAAVVARVTTAAPLTDVMKELPGTLVPVTVMPAKRPAGFAIGMSPFPVTLAAVVARVTGPGRLRPGLISSTAP